MARSEPGFGGRDVFVTTSVRTPFGRFGGLLRDVAPIALGATTLRAALARTASAELEELVVGTGCLEGGEFVPARQLAITAGLPDTVPTLTIDRACCSGLTAIGLVWKDVSAGHCRTAGAVGVDVLSQTPYFAKYTRWGKRRGDFTVQDPLAFRAPFLGDVAIAKYTGEVSLARDHDRDEQDAWAVQSHQRYGDSLAAGRFDRQALTWEEVLGEACPRDWRTSASARRDEQYRPGTDADTLARLPTVYGSPTVTAGNAPGLNDGAAAVVLSAEPPPQDGPRVRIVDYLQIAGTPTSAAYLPGQAIARLAELHAIPIRQFAAIEINEAFAATPLCSIDELVEAGGDAARLRETVNPWGGAVASGHPLGASGVRLTANVIDQLTARGGGVGVAAICGGFGQADALLIDVS